MRKVIFLLAIVLSISSLGFAEAPPSVRVEMLVTADWLENNLDHTDVVILHIAKTRENYEAGHIPGAQFLAWNEIATTRYGIPNEIPPVEDLLSLVRRFGIDETDRVIVYSEDAGLFAARAYVVFDYLGMGEQVALLDGHWTKWQAEGRPTSTEVPSVTSSSYEPLVRPEIVMYLNPLRDIVWTKTNLPNSPITIIDARPEDQYTGETPGDGVTRPGHIPGAINVFWMNNVESKENPVFKPVDQLRQLYTEAGADSSDGVIVTYCRTGGQASHSYFTMKYLGYTPHIYDGSFFEWSAAEDTPVKSGLE
jgi:thiosulfate/3-mercaptopyruvate sulfurtransferase